eukprot:scaffold656949_cov62-Prasinocladus_malaysianus.AAC.1
MDTVVCRRSTALPFLRSPLQGNFKMVDPAIMVKDIGAVTGKLKISAKGKRKEKTATHTTSEEVVDAIAERMNRINDSNEKVRKKRDGVKASWGKAQK